MNTEHERIKFEAACHRHAEEAGHEGAAKLERDGDGYADPATQAAWWGWREGRAALQSQATEAFPCRIVEADFEAGTVTLEMHGKYTVSSGQKYLCDAPLQSQDAEDAERYRRLRKGDIDNVAVVRGLGAMDYGASAVVATYSEEIDGDDLDTTIDRARRAEGDGE